MTWTQAAAETASACTLMAVLMVPQSVPRSRDALRCLLAQRLSWAIQPCCPGVVEYRPGLAAKIKQPGASGSEGRLGLYFVRLPHKAPSLAPCSQGLEITEEPLSLVEHGHLYPDQECRARLVSGTPLWLIWLCRKAVPQLEPELRLLMPLPEVPRRPAWRWTASSACTRLSGPGTGTALPPHTLPSAKRGQLPESSLSSSTPFSRLQSTAWRKVGRTFAQLCLLTALHKALSAGTPQHGDKA